MECGPWLWQDRWMSSGGFARPTNAGPGLWDGYYINLDRSPERRRRMETELVRHGLAARYQRFPAVDGRLLKRPSPVHPGEAGIFRSHLDVLRKVASSDRPAHIMEDDVVFSDLTVPSISAAVNGPLLRTFDILFQETYVGVTIASIRKYNQTYERATRDGPVLRPEQLKILDLGSGYQGGATSYLISPRSAGRLAALLEDEWARGPTMPVDSFMKIEAAAGRLRVGCVFPFVITVDLESSWISDADRDEVHGRPLLELLIRHAFFVRRDIPAAGTVLDRVLGQLPAPEKSDAMALYSRIVEYYLTCPPVRTSD